MNACIRAAVRAALASGLKIKGISRGYDGLINGEIVRLGRRAVANIIHQGGTVLGTARSEEFRTKEGREKAIKVLNKEEIEGLVLIGGDGTFRGGTLLSEESGIKIIGIPGTIDNDCYGTDYTIGFDTAINTALQAIDRIRDTAESHNRLFFVEVMGRHTGFIALKSGIAGGAEEVLLPEAPLSAEEFCSRLQKNYLAGKKSAIVIVAEGDQPGESFHIAEEVKQRINLDSRVVILGHTQRGGSPTARDRVLASRLGVSAVEALLDGVGGVMVGVINEEISYTPLKDTWEKKKPLQPSLTGLLKYLAD
jgi:6-phosphofructokinase 1